MNFQEIKANKSIQELLDFSILNIDKPSGPTCFDVDTHIKTKLKLNKTSHFGTLDPKVTGVLPIALNRACRLMDYFIKKNKTYVGEMQLHSEISLDDLKEIIKKFIGKIMQKPPVRSRVKRVEREREIYKFEILKEVEKGKKFEFEVECQAGTYVRKLIHDLGLLIGGAHMTSLRRTCAGIFSEKDDNFISLKQFDEAVSEFESGNEQKLCEILIPGEIICEILPTIYLLKESEKQILNGSPIFEKYLDKENWKKIRKLKENECFCGFVKDNLDRFIGVYKRTKDCLGKPDFVLN